MVSKWIALVNGFKGFLFRLGAVVVGLLAFAAFEGVLVFLDVGSHPVDQDPYVGFTAIHPLFVRKQDRYETAPSRLEFFRTASFKAPKATKGFRIFCLGGSTVLGHPFANETAFTTWLRLSLESADPTRDWEVVNCGGVSYATYRLVPILDEVLNHDPDLLVLYCGHNEFLEDRSYENLKQAPWLLVSAHQWAAPLRTYGVLRSLIRRSSASAEEPRTILPAEADARLDHFGGLDLYHRDENWRRGVIAHFADNLGRMIRGAQARGVPVIVCNPVCNLRDCPPFKSQHRDDLTPADFERLNVLWEQARLAYGSDLAKAIGLLQEACAIDDQHAGLQFELAKCHEELGESAAAREVFLRAKDLDICPLRILEPMNQLVLDIARKSGVPLVDVRGAIETRSRLGIPGDDWLVDHVHPSIEGHQFIAGMLFNEMVALGMVQPRDGWETARESAFRQRFESLDDLYFLRGQVHLANLKKWTQGKAERRRPPSKGS